MLSHDLTDEFFVHGKAQFVHGLEGDLNDPLAAYLIHVCDPGGVQVLSHEHAKRIRLRWIYRSLLDQMDTRMA